MARKHRTYSTQIALGALVVLAMSAVLALATFDQIDYAVHNATAVALIILSIATLLVALSCRTIERDRQRDRRQ